MAITLPDETKVELLSSIQHYFQEERGEEIGNLQASLFLEFVLKEVGPTIYNQAVRDAQARLQATIVDLDTTLYEPEFGYTAERRSRRSGRGKVGR